MPKKTASTGGTGGKGKRSASKADRKSGAKVEAMSAPQAADLALSRLDPLLMLGAFSAPEESVSVPPPAPRVDAVAFAAEDEGTGAAALDLTSAAAAMPRGMRSLAAQMSGPALKSFLVDDLVPVLVDVADHERVAGQIREMQGTALALTPTTLAVNVPRTRLADLARVEGVRYVEEDLGQLAPRDTQLEHVAEELADGRERGVADPFDSIAPRLRRAGEVHR